MCEFVENNVISNTRLYKPVTNKRRAQIWFNFKELKNGKWWMHMHADYIPSQDSEVTNPYEVMQEITKVWMSDVDKLLGREVKVDA
jgi:hypothetical protein